MVELRKTLTPINYVSWEKSEVMCVIEVRVIMSLNDYSKYDTSLKCL